MHSPEQETIWDNVITPNSAKLDIFNSSSSYFDHQVYVFMTENSTSKYHVLTEFVLKIITFWDVAPCRLVQSHHRRFVSSAFILRIKQLWVLDPEGSA
jgi:hypothetical protein